MKAELYYQSERLKFIVTDEVPMNDGELDKEEVFDFLAANGVVKFVRPNEEGEFIIDDNGTKDVYEILPQHWEELESAGVFSIKCIGKASTLK